jgi:hypothetical protein
MLADPDFAAMVQAIGRASLGADERTIWHLTKCYCERQGLRVWSFDLGGWAWGGLGCRGWLPSISSAGLSSQFRRWPE